MVRFIAPATVLAGALLLGVAVPAIAQPGPGLTVQIMHRWLPACDTPEARAASVQVGFTLGDNGRIASGPEWLDPPLELLAGAPEIAARTAAFNRAKAAINLGAPYVRLDPGLYNVPIVLTFDAQTACPSE